MAPRADSADYGGILLGGAALLDTRAPAEFAHGAFPGAVNLPLMSDEERAAVGTCYKQRGQAAAMALGHELVSGALREARLRAWVDFARAHPDGYLYCFRGGLRSQIVQQWLQEAGVSYPRITGGYKAMRRFLIDALAQALAERELVLVAGATGSGKTRAVQALARAVDLEGLARHRGSAFGRLLDAQPAQIDFENALSIALLRLARDPGALLCEDEGKLIGRLALPESLRQRMVDAPLLVIDESLEPRVQVLLEDYVVDLGERYQARYGDGGASQHRARLFEDLGRIRKRLGGERVQRVAGLMAEAFDAQAAGGDIARHRDWIRLLLTDYYDPMYAYQMSRRQGRRLFTGSRAEVVAFAAEQLDRA
jgi:tRNA 2-selenouridine synthase